MVPRLSQRSGPTVLIVSITVALAASCTQSSPTADRQSLAPTSVTEISPSPTSNAGLSSTTASATTTTVTAATHFERVGSEPPSTPISGDGHTVVVVVNGSLESFKADGTPLATLQGDATNDIDQNCGIATTTNLQGASTLYTLRHVSRSAQGLIPQTTAWYLTAWNLTTFSKVRETEFRTVEPNATHCTLSGGSLVATTDGRGLAVSAVGGTDAVVNADTGEQHNVDGHPFVRGPYIAAISHDAQSASGNEDVGRVYNPQTFAAVSEMRGRSSDGNTPLDLFRRAGVRSTKTDQSAISEDGSRAVATIQGNGGIAVLNVATGKVERIVGKGDLSYNPYIDSAAGIVFASDDVHNQLYAYSVASGERLWVQNSIETICRTAHGQINVIANKQMVLLNESDGKQLDFTTAVESCPLTYGNYDYTNNGSIIQMTD